MKIFFASDHAGLVLKDALRKVSAGLGHEVVDLGTVTEESVDYPDYARKVADAIKKEPAARGVLVCGTGIGISIAANRFSHIRAALCHDTTGARLARAHNDANVLAVGGRTTGLAVAEDIVKTFLETPFEGGRHEGRVKKLGL